MSAGYTRGRAGERRRHGRASSLRIRASSAWWSSGAGFVAPPEATVYGFDEFGEYGRVVPPDPAAIAGAVSDLLAQPGLAARLGRAGRDRYAKLIPGWGSVVDRLLA